MSFLSAIWNYLRNDDMRYSNPADNQTKPYWFRQTVADLQRHEGYREFAYPDPLSKIGRMRIKGFGYQPARGLLALHQLDARDGAPWTVGYGETGGVTPDSVRPPALAARKLEMELTEHLEVLDRLIPSWTVKPDYVKTVLANMAYNLGYNRLRPFAPTLAEFDKGNYKTAAGRLRNTLWFRQVGERAEELVERLETGKVQDQYKI